MSDELSSMTDNGLEIPLNPSQKEFLEALAGTLIRFGYFEVPDLVRKDDVLMITIRPTVIFKDMFTERDFNGVIDDPENFAYVIKLPYVLDIPSSEQLNQDVIRIVSLIIRYYVFGGREVIFSHSEKFAEKIKTNTNESQIENDKDVPAEGMASRED